MNARGIFGGVVVAVMLIALGGASALGRSKTLSESQVRKVAYQEARSAGDPHPALVEYVLTTRAKANALALSALIPDNSPSFLIAERGRFSANLPRPAGSSAPNGVVIVFVMNATTGAMTDFGLGHQYPRLAKLGRVIALHR